MLGAGEVRLIPKAFDEGNEWWGVVICTGENSFAFLAALCENLFEL